MTKRREVPKDHPWKKFNPFTTKPEGIKIISGYLTENPKFKKSKKVTSQSGVSTNTH